LKYAVYRDGGGIIGIDARGVRLDGLNYADSNDSFTSMTSAIKNSCLDVIRRVEATGQSVSITRRGKVVARLAPSFQAMQRVDAKPWQQLRGLGGEWPRLLQEQVVTLTCEQLNWLLDCRPQNAGHAKAAASEYS
jgi:antitoxin (DNA-binding transcriptional repressor) of toxin-antitoxin stability system